MISNSEKTSGDTCKRKQPNENSMPNGPAEVKDFNLFNIENEVPKKQSVTPSHEEFSISDDIMDFINENINEACFTFDEDNGQVHCDKIRDYFKVTEVKSLSATEKILKCKLRLPEEEEEDNHHEGVNTTVVVKLIGLWAETCVDPDDCIFLSAKYNKDESCYVIADEYYCRKEKTNKTIKKTQSQSIEILENFFIVEPEILLAPTKIKSAFPCYRRSIFLEQFKFNAACNSTSKDMLVGSIIHEVFENVIRNYSLSGERIKEEFVILKLNQIIKEYYIDMAILKLSPDEVVALCQNFIKNIIKFFTNYFQNNYSISGLKIKRFVGAEQLYQSQVLGMKGLVDMIVETSNEENQVEITPFELKTGYYFSNQDIMQVLVYCLILSEQLERKSYNGILFYLKKDSLFRVRVNVNDIINVMVVRNNIAKYLKNLEKDPINYQKGLPRKYHLSRECDKCYQKNVCLWHYANYEDKDTQLDEKVASYIKDSECQIYFDFFFKIINQEETYTHLHEKSLIKNGTTPCDISEFKKFFISKISPKGSCSIDLTLVEENEDINIDINKFTSSLDDNIVSQYSEMRDSYHIYDQNMNKSYIGVLVQKTDSAHSSQLTVNILRNYITKNNFKEGDSLFIKNLEYSSKFSFKLMRGNLIALCSMDQDEKVLQLRNLIVTLTKPGFNMAADFKKSTMEFLKENFLEEFSILNFNQKTAVLKALLCENYALIIGFPGSGKTTLISLIIQILVKQKKKVLVSAHTNTAIDNILLKLAKTNVVFSRISNQDNTVHPQLREFIFKNQKYETFSEWREYLNSISVFGVTALGVTNKVLSCIDFDYCIVDEACQTLEPALLGPLLLVKKFILVGDPFQLPALLRGNVSSPPSLFERLVDKYPETSVQLTEQYRMNKEILKLSNECVYENIMKCANSDISNRRLLVHMAYLANISPQWILDVINPEKPVLIVDYYKYAMKHFDEKILTTVIDSNEIECQLICQLIKAFNTSGIFNENFDINQDIGIITPYKSQESLLIKELAKSGFYNVYTIDKSQGIEKEVIIISFVKTNSQTKILRDIARINVAFTRPRSKLIIVGLIKSLRAIEKLKSYVELLLKEGWYYELEDI